MIKPANFWRDLNVFVAASILIVALGGFLVFVPAALLMQLVLPAREAEIVAYPLGYALVAAGLGYWWWKRGLSPRVRDPLRERRFRWGHAMLAVVNLMLAALYGFAAAGGFNALLVQPEMRNVFVPILTMAPLALIAGLVMVWTSRASAALATAPAPLPVVDENGVVQPAPVAVAVVRPPSSAVAIVGMIVSTFMVATVAVFLGAAFESDMRMFTQRVLPALGILYVLYLAAAILMLLKRRRAARWVAWGPVVLLMVGLPVVQLVVMGLGALGVLPNS